MHPILYYLPAGCDHDAALAALGYAFDGRSPATRGVDRGAAGPGGGRGGCVVAHPDHAGGIGLYPDRQIWHPHPLAGPGVMLGWTGDPPGPDDLARERQIGIYDALPLGDGRRWRVPTAMIWPEGETSPAAARERAGCALPMVRTLAEDGSVVRRPKREYEALRLAADEVWQAFETGATLDDEDQMRLAAVALGTNYRLGPAEISALELLDDQSFLLLCLALVDGPNWPENGK